MDCFDHAQELDAYYRNEALAAAREKNPGSGGVSRSHCLECGEEIPERRRLAVPGCERCIACQRELEQS